MRRGAANQQCSVIGHMMLLSELHNRPSKDTNAYTTQFGEETTKGVLIGGSCGLAVFHSRVHTFTNNFPELWTHQDIAQYPQPQILMGGNRKHGCRHYTRTSDPFPNTLQPQTQCGPQPAEGYPSPGTTSPYVCVGIVHRLLI